MDELVEKDCGRQARIEHLPADEDQEAPSPALVDQRIEEALGKGGEKLLEGRRRFPAHEFVEHGQPLISQRAQHGPERLEIELVLAAEVVVHRSHVALGLGRDVAHRGRVETLFRKELLCCLEDPLVGFPSLGAGVAGNDGRFHTISQHTFQTYILNICFNLSSATERGSLEVEPVRCQAPFSSDEKESQARADERACLVLSMQKTTSRMSGGGLERGAIFCHCSGGRPPRWGTTLIPNNAKGGSLGNSRRGNRVRIDVFRSAFLNMILSSRFPSNTFRTLSHRAPPGRASRSALPATRQAAGVPSAWSQPPESTHARPRRWCDAGRWDATASQRPRRPVFQLLCPP